MVKKLTLGAIALAASTMIGSAASNADYIGFVFTGETGAATNATIAQFAALGGAAAADATFTVPSINFSVPNSDAATVGMFVGASCVGVGCSATLDNSYFFIQTAPGFLSTNTNSPINTVSIMHDDGVQLQGSVNGLIIDAPGPTSPETSTGPWSAPQTIMLSYGECCSGPAILQPTLGETAVSTPEPASLAILGAALAGFGIMMRRRRKMV
jgi:hypothetical protein